MKDPDFVLCSPDCKVTQPVTIDVPKFLVELSKIIGDIPMSREKRLLIRVACIDILNNLSE